MRRTMPFRPRKIVTIGCGLALVTVGAVAVVTGSVDPLGHPVQAYGSVADAQQVSPDVLATPQQVTVRWDGKKQTTVSTAPTVGGLLGNLGIALHPADTVRPTVRTSLTGVSSVVVTRVRHTKQVKRVRLAYKVKKRKDAALTVGHKRVLKTGRAGVAKVTYDLTYVNGKITHKKKVKTSVVVKPKARIVAFGTLPSGVGASPAKAKTIAKELLTQRGWGGQFSCLSQMWDRESGWNLHAANSAGAYGIPQALPGSKMASVSADWRNNARTQIAWGLNYIAGRYGTPCSAWSRWQAQGWY